MQWKELKELMLIQRTHSLQKTERVFCEAHQGNQSTVWICLYWSDTIENASDNGLAGIALEAHASLILDAESVIQKANDAGVFLVAIDPAEYA